MTDHIGLPVYWALLFYQTDSLGPQDAEICKSSSAAVIIPPTDTSGRIRDAVHRDFPDLVIYRQAADIITQVLNFGLSAPIDVQITGKDINASYKIARELKSEIETVPGAVDVRIAQVLNYPTLRVDVDRAKALRRSASPNTTSP